MPYTYFIEQPPKADKARERKKRTLTRQSCRTRPYLTAYRLINPPLRASFRRNRTHERRIAGVPFRPHTAGRLPSGEKKRLWCGVRTKNSRLRGSVHGGQRPRRSGVWRSSRGRHPHAPMSALLKAEDWKNEGGGFVLFPCLAFPTFFRRSFDDEMASSVTFGKYH